MTQQTNNTPTKEKQESKLSSDLFDFDHKKNDMTEAMGCSQSGDILGQRVKNIYQGNKGNSLTEDIEEVLDDENLTDGDKLFLIWKLGHVHGHFGALRGMMG